MKKRLFILLAALVALVTKAGADNYGLQVFGVEVTDANKNDLTTAINNYYSTSGLRATGIMKYDSGKRKLTLNNFTLVTDKAQTALYFYDSSKSNEIEVIGNNRVGADNYALHAYGWTLTFSGTGKLVLDRTYTYTNFVMHQNGTAVIQNATLDIKGECYPQRAQLIVDGGIFLADAISSSGPWSSITLQNNSAIFKPEGATASDLSTICSGQPVHIGPENRKDPGISWPYESITVGRWDNDGVIATLANPYNLSGITCSANKTGIVRIVDNYTVMASGQGTTKVTATFPGNATYRPATVTMEVTVLYGADIGGWNHSEATVTYNDNPNHIYGLPIFSKRDDYPIHFESSDPSVATIDNEGNITVLHPGVTNLNAIFDGDYQHQPQTVTCILTVNRYVASLYWNKATNGTYTTSYGGSCDAYYYSSPSGLPATFESSDPTIATVDATGKVTVKEIGETTITATFDGDEFNAPATSCFILTVTKGKPSLSWSKSSISLVWGQTFNAPTLSNNSNLPVTFNSSNTSVATIDATGNVTIKAIGETTISAVFDGNEHYNPTTVSYTLKVTERLQSGIYWARSSSSVNIGVPYTPPRLYNPKNLPITFMSSCPDIASIDDEGNVTINAVGETTISVVFAGDNIYEPITASYTLTVTDYRAVYWHNDQYTVNLNSKSSIYLPSCSKAAGIDTKKIKYNSSNPEVATINAGGYITIHGIGETQLIVSYPGDNRYSARESTCTLTVTTGDQKAAFIHTTLYYYCCKNKGFYLQVYPNNVELTDWKTEDASIATVSDDGWITPKASGSGYISAKYWDDDLSKYVQIGIRLHVCEKGDVHVDDNISLQDLRELVYYLHNTESNYFNFDSADINNDGVVNIVDVALLIELLKAQ